MSDEQNKKAWQAAFKKLPDDVAKTLNSDQLTRLLECVVSFYFQGQQDILKFVQQEQREIRADIENKRQEAKQPENELKNDSLNILEPENTVVHIKINYYHDDFRYGASRELRQVFEVLASDITWNMRGEIYNLKNEILCEFHHAPR